MIDIHTHILPNVDDGSISIDTSISLLMKEKEIGVNKIICTPHYRKGMFEESIEKITNTFNLIQKEAEKIGIELFLGQEIMCTSPKHVLDIINKDLIIPMNNTAYLLFEFSYYDNPDINEILYNAKIKGYKVIIAHVERYKYLTIDDIDNFKQEGALIQVNAESIIGKYGLKTKKFIKKLIKKNLVDFVASDIHHNRTNYLLDAYHYIQKKFGANTAERLFKENAENILKRNDFNG